MPKVYSTWPFVRGKFERLLGRSARLRGYLFLPNKALRDRLLPSKVALTEQMETCLQDFVKHGISSEGEGTAIIPRAGAAAPAVPAAPAEPAPPVVPSPGVVNSAPAQAPSDADAEEKLSMADRLRKWKGRGKV